MKRISGFVLFLILLAQVLIPAVTFAAVLSDEPEKFTWTYFRVTGLDPQIKASEPESGDVNFIRQSLGDLDETETHFLENGQGRVIVDNCNPGFGTFIVITDPRAENPIPIQIQSDPSGGGQYAYPCNENPDEFGTLEISLLVTNFDDLTFENPVGPFVFSLINSSNNLVGVPVSVGPFDEPPSGNQIFASFSNVPAGDDYSVRIEVAGEELTTIESINIDVGSIVQKPASVSVQDVQTIVDPSANGGVGEAIPDTCESVNGSLGWLMCAGLRATLDAFDGFTKWFVDILNFEIDTSGSDTEGTSLSTNSDVLTDIWAGFRTLANLGFVIAFFVLIYSAATGGVLSAYSVKRLAPRLFIGAVGVQFSLFISIELVNLFNILGSELGEIITSPLGSDNTGVAAIAVDNSPLGRGAGQAIPFAIFIIIALIITAWFSILGILIMAIVFLARNMGLLILIVLSPLAFVAWILPNTESIFKRWWGLFIQLLALYPIAALFLASGKLMGAIWMGVPRVTSAPGPIDDVAESDWIKAIVGTIALFAPYFLAPKMFQFAGRAVSQVVGAVDGVRNGVKDRGGKLTGSRVGQKARSGNLIQPGRRFSRPINAVSRGVTNPLSTRVNVLSGSRNRRLAGSKQQYENTLKEDTSAADILQRDRIAQARSAADTSNIDSSLQRTNPEKYAREMQSARDKAEVDYLVGVLSSSGSTDYDKRAAFGRLANVHSTDEVGATAVVDFVRQAKSTNNVSLQALGDKVTEENLSALLNDIPQSVRGYKQAASLATSKVITMKSGAMAEFANNSDSEAVNIMAGKYIEAAQNENLRGSITEGNASKLVTAMRNNKIDTSEIERHYDVVMKGTDSTGRAVYSATLKPLGTASATPPTGGDEGDVSGRGDDTGFDDRGYL